MHRRSNSQERARIQHWQARRRRCASARRAWSLSWYHCGCAQALLSACACSRATPSTTRHKITVKIHCPCPVFVQEHNSCYA